MVLKYKFNLKDISLEDFRVYFFALFKALIPKKKIKNISDLEKFIQKKSAWVTQVTLYSYLKTRMGTCLLYTSPSPRDRQKSRMPSSA